MTDQWTWSAEMYVIHGTAHTRSSPTTALLRAHKHPEDRAKTDSVLDFLSTGERYACYHRILDAESRKRYGWSWPEALLTPRAP